MLDEIDMHKETPAIKRNVSDFVEYSSATCRMQHYERCSSLADAGESGRRDDVTLEMCSLILLMEPTSPLFISPSLDFLKVLAPLFAFLVFFAFGRVPTKEPGIDVAVADGLPVNSMDGDDVIDGRDVVEGAIDGDGVVDGDGVEGDVVGVDVVDSDVVGGDVIGVDVVCGDVVGAVVVVIVGGDVSTENVGTPVSGRSK
mmetsp:Transcript_9437/g.19883  ORF Transcript_9437/g.19883 Transcript_9437/m.19883 type:complete len:200 (+) Transcript_9437:302-901(+)